MLTRRTLLAATATVLAGRTARADIVWPARLVRLISSSPPAGASDILTRTLGQALEAQLGQSFLVENKSGAAGVIGADFVAKSPPDGYTWLTTNVGPQAINATLLPQQPFDPRKDFRHVTIIGRLPVVMLVNKDVPAKDLAAFVALAKQKPGGLNFGSGGIGTLLHLTGELLKIAAGINLQHVPYRGAQAATQDLMGGRIEAMFDSLPSAAPHIRSGTVRALAVSSAARSPTFSDIPTIAEQGYPSVVTTNWFGFAGPAGVPEDIVTKLHGEVVRALKSPAVIERLDRIGVQPGGDPPVETQAFVLAEIERWAKVVTETGTKINQ
ncbi:MAG: putative tricarboxylic transport rane protein [Hyphomicrobiales bacterium]|jgi:tripartite-type tricarboxylate transporter receptor subunit TctC|nr:putative tricarboxylic transport rane protein [Hyphomicrobiales bacterium]